LKLNINTKKMTGQKDRLRESLGMAHEHPEILSPSLEKYLLHEKYACVITSGTVRIHMGSCYGCDLYNYFEIRYIDYDLTSALSCLEHSNV